jgi:hypothetical protein
MFRKVKSPPAKSGGLIVASPSKWHIHKSPLGDYWGTTTIPSFFGHKHLTLMPRGRRAILVAVFPYPNRTDQND